MTDPTLLFLITQASEQPVTTCYHCHKCTSGCPVVAEMEYGPDRILRMVQLGEKERLLASHDIWLCASCETCGARCPNEIDIARVMDALRQLSLAEKTTAAEPDAQKFHRLFLFVVRHLGRMHEAALFGGYKLWTRHFLADMDSGVRMIVKGKVPLLPDPVKDRRAIQRIYEKTSGKKS